MPRLVFALSLLFVAFSRPVLGQGSGVGTRVDLTPKLPLNVGTTGQFCQLFIPEYYETPPDGLVTLVFHLHSASWAAEDEVYRARANAIVVNIHLGAFSSPYAAYFTDPARFQQVIDTALSALAQRGLVTQPAIGTLILTSFSAGYAGVREMLKVGASYDRINALALADGLHSNSDAATKAIQMMDFVRFAADAREGKKVLLLTHSSITTSGYENTTQTADYLIAGIGSLRQAFSNTDEIGQQYSRCDTGTFRLRGYYGDTAADHLKHLYAMHLMVSQALSLLGGATSVPRKQGEIPRDEILFENYPNPFNASTEIAFHVPVRSDVRLEVFDALGRKLQTILRGEFGPGDYRTRYDAVNTPSGTYYLSLLLGARRESRRIVLTK